MAKSRYKVASLHPDDLTDDEDIIDMITYINEMAEDGYVLMPPVVVKGHMFLFMELKEDMPIGAEIIDKGITGIPLHPDDIEVL